MAWRSASVANNTSKFDYQTAMQIAEAWKAALSAYKRILVDMENMMSYFNSAGLTDATDYRPFINNIREEKILEKIEYSFISEDTYSSQYKNSLDMTQSAVRSASTSSEAKWLSEQLKKWCFWEEYLRLHKAMQTPNTVLTLNQVDSLWRSVIYR